MRTWHLNFSQKSRQVIAYACLALLIDASHIHALQSEWVDLPNARARLLADGDPMNGRLIAGLEIELDQGWKTYWRMPGDSGIPLTLDWSASQNIADQNILYPTPVRFTDDYGQSIGYKHRVLFPMELTLDDYGHGSEITFDAFMGICRDICIPVKQTFSLSVPPLLFATQETRTLLADALARVAKPLNTEDRPRLISVDASSEADIAPRLNMELPAHLQDQVDDVLIEGPASWFLSLPTATDGGAWTLPLDGTPKGELPWGAPIRVTIIKNGQSYEAMMTIPTPND